MSGWEISSLKVTFIGYYAAARGFLTKPAIPPEMIPPWTTTTLS
jgi:hypothetical protein